MTMMEPGNRTDSGGSRSGLLVLFIFVVAGVAGAWWFTRGRLPGGLGGPGQGADTGAAMAAAVPQETQVFLAFDLRGKVKPEALLAKVDEIRARSPEVAKKLDEAEKQGGVTLKSLARWVEPAGCFVVFPREGQQGLFPTTSDGPDARKPPEVVVLLPVRDEAAARADLAALGSKAPTKPREVKVDDVTCYQAGQADPAPTWGVANGWLFFGSGTAALARTLKAIRHQAPALSDDATFKEARARITARTDVFGFVRVGTIFESMIAFPPIGAYTDQSTKTAAQGIGYKVAAMDLTSDDGETQAFLKLDPKSQSDFVKALLAPQKAPRATMALVPAKWGQCTSVNLTWVGKVYYELACLFPRVRSQVAGLPMMLAFQIGFNPFEKFQEVSNGDLVGSTNALEQQMEALKGSLKGLVPAFQGARGQGQLTACKSNLKNLGTGLEMFSTDHGGRYPAKLEELSPNYLKQIPTCPAAGRDTYSGSYTSGSSPDRYKVYCSGHHHQDVGLAADEPIYDSEKGLSSSPSSTAKAPAGFVAPNPSYLAVLSVKDLPAAAALMERVEKAAKLTPRATTRVGDVEVHGYDRPSMRWALVDKPEKALVLAYGPDAETRLADALASPAHAADSMESQKLLAGMIQEAKGQVVWADYTDMTKALQVLAEALQTFPLEGVPPEGKEALDKAVASLKGATLVSASLLTVETDGVRFRGKGLNMPMLAAGVGIGAAILVPNFIRARAQGQLTACKSNQKNIGTALEMWSTDNGGRFPTSLDKLAPNYLKVIPTCPSVGRDTYSPGFQSAASPDAYTVVCTGHNHAGVGQGENYPQYTSTQGLISQ